MKVKRCNIVRFVEAKNCSGCLINDFQPFFHTLTAHSVDEDSVMVSALKRLLFKGSIKYGTTHRLHNLTGIRNGIDIHLLTD